MLSQSNDPTDSSIDNPIDNPINSPINDRSAGFRQSESVYQLALPFEIDSTHQRDADSEQGEGRRSFLSPIRFKSLGHIGLVLLVVGGAIAWTRQQELLFAPSSTAVATQVNTIQVDAVEIEQADSFSIDRQYAGEVVAGRTSELGFERSGELIWIGVDRGDRIEADQVLAQLDTRQLQAQRSQLVAQRDQAQALLRELEAGPRQEDIDAAQSRVLDLENQLQLARIQQNRREYLYEEGAISQDEFDEVAFGAEALDDRMAAAQSQLDELIAGTRVEQLEAQRSVVRQLTARIEDVDIAIEKGSLMAPFSGIISERRMDEGTVVDGGESVLRLVEDAQTEVEIGVPVDALAALPMGSQRSITINGELYPATVRAILPELDTVTRTQQVVFTLNGGHSVKHSPGQIAELAIAQSTSDVGYWMPTAALVPGDRGLWACYVLVEDDASLESDVNASDVALYQVERRDVEVLHTDGEQSFIRGMVQPGDRIVSHGTQRLVPGQQVQWTDS